MVWQAIAARPVDDCVRLPNCLASVAVRARGLREKTRHITRRSVWFERVVRLGLRRACPAIPDVPDDGLVFWPVVAGATAAR